MTGQREKKKEYIKNPTHRSGTQDKLKDGLSPRRTTYSNSGKQHLDLCSIITMIYLRAKLAETN